jgi:hypothetical protein
VKELAAQGYGEYVKLFEGGEEVNGYGLSL